ncbi:MULTISPECIES: flavodoxin domain-containing protein [Pseudomonas]|jgi:MioC protein|uniref:MioC protein n=3 Tax=Pseudomonas TaxID=286 RepID=A0AAW8M977_9PSED|nr:MULTISPECIES: flavodoxin domain-containing protein [Pseudomonas]KKA09923.1 nitric oxide synthase [Pseudomonas ogarae]MBO1537122.1 flavodoxin domain-containing protein [Pseudomonas sp. OA65]MDR6958326.1 MioC protein [Pseudomonas brassicacearum]QXI51447.1 flavodoxin domain-containing protein [Pseudomonas alvandae]WGT28034.1 flavodoxin domain-containing protein [Pseudomonas marginalis]
MSEILIVFGTESGNSEMAADDIAACLGRRGITAEIKSMEDVSVAGLKLTSQLVVVTSTYGEGELPETTAPFFEALVEKAPDLSSVNFFAFGLGDSTYEKFNNAIDVISAKLVELGAIKIGETGRHDAASGKSVTMVANAWFEQVYN